MAKPKLKKVQADLRKAAEILGKEDMTIREYRPVAKKYNLTMPQKIVAELGWNRMKTFVFDGDYKPRPSKYTLEEKLEGIRRAMNRYGVELTLTQYKLFSKGKNIPAATTVISNHSWSNIKDLALDNTTIKKLKLKEEKKDFCDLCVYNKSCTIEIDDCKYWEEARNEMY